MLEKIYFESSLWLVELVILGLFVVSMEVGFRWGRYRGRIGKPTGGQSTTVQAAVLGFLALVLGFTFSVSQSRFDTKRQLVVEEANAIGTTALRARMLPSPYREKTLDLLRRYANSRTPATLEQVDKAIAESLRLHKQLWAQATAVAHVEQNPAVVMLYTQALNDMIDLHTKRVAAYLYRAPPGLLLLLTVAAALVIAVMGYGSGLEKERNLLGMSVMVILVSLVLFLVLDLERPQDGIIRANLKPLYDVQADLRASS